MIMYSFVVMSTSAMTIGSSCRPSRRPSRSDEIRFFPTISVIEKQEKKQKKTYYRIDSKSYLVAGAGFEPTTFGLWARRATELLHPAIFYCFSLLSPECLFIISQMNVNVNTFFAIFLFWLKTLDYCIQIGYNIYDIGVWRRLVARYLGVVEVVGSNPVTPTKAKGCCICNSLLLLIIYKTHR